MFSQKTASGGSSLCLAATVLDAAGSTPQAPLPPVFNVYYTRPAVAAVFRCAEKGKPDDLIRLISSGDASLRDRDPWGDTLLHRAAAGENLEMCKFLVGQGLDVNASQIYGSVPLNDAFDGKDMHGGSIAVGEYLLSLPATDSTTSPRMAHSFFITAAGYNSRALPLWQHAIAEDVELGGEAAVYHGDSPFHLACEEGHLGLIRQFLTPESVKAVDAEGQTGLHRLLRDIYQERGWQNDLECIKLLIENGADVHASDLNGTSCSELVYLRHSDCKDLAGPTSYPGDMWDVALAATGHYVRVFREKAQIPRQGRYGECGMFGTYDTEDFKDFWKGMEHKCPYFKQALREAGEQVDSDSERSREAESQNNGEPDDSEYETASENGAADDEKLTDED